MEAVIPMAFSQSGRLLFADISGYQASANLAEYRKAGGKVIAIKAGEGDTVDPSFEHHIGYAHQEGLRVICYQFIRPKASRTGRDEAKMALDNILRFTKLKKDILCADWETDNGLPAWESLHYFRQFQSEATLHKPNRFVTYSYSAFLARFHTLPNLGRLWLADYAAKAWVPFGRWWAWQRTDGVHGPLPHSLPGIDQCDVSLLSHRASLQIRLGRGL